VTIRLGKLGS
jgi:hypothetical protein